MKYTVLVLAILLPFYAATAAEQPQNASKFPAPAWHVPTMQGMLTAPATWWAGAGLAPLIVSYGIRLGVDLYRRLQLKKAQLMHYMKPYVYCANELNLFNEADQFELSAQDHKIIELLPRYTDQNRYVYLRSKYVFGEIEKQLSDGNKEFDQLSVEAQRYNDAKVLKRALPQLLAPYAKKMLDNPNIGTNQGWNDTFIKNGLTELKKNAEVKQLLKWVYKDIFDQKIMKDVSDKKVQLSGKSVLGDTIDKGNCSDDDFFNEFDKQFVFEIAKSPIWAQAKAIAGQEGYAVSDDSIDDILKIEKAAIFAATDQQFTLESKNKKSVSLLTFAGVGIEPAEMVCTVKDINNFSAEAFFMSEAFAKLLNHQKSGYRISFNNDALIFSFKKKAGLITEYKVTGPEPLGDGTNAVVFKDKEIGVAGSKTIQQINQRIIKQHYLHKKNEVTDKKKSRYQGVARDEKIQLVERPEYSWFFYPLYWLWYGEKAVKKKEIIYEPTFEDYAESKDINSDNGKMIRFTSAQRDLRNKIHAGLGCDDSLSNAIFSGSIPKDPQLRAAFDNYCFALLSFQHKKTNECAEMKRVSENIDRLCKKIFNTFITAKYEDAIGVWQGTLPTKVEVSGKDASKLSLGQAKQKQVDAIESECKKLFNAHDNLVEAAIEFYDELLKKKGYDLLYGKDAFNCGGTLNIFGVHEAILTHHGFDKKNNWALDKEIKV